MSSRQALSRSSDTNAAANSQRPTTLLTFELIGHLRDRTGIEVQQESLGFAPFEAWVRGFDTQEEFVASRRAELFRVEDRMVRHRQSVQGKHAERSPDTGKQHCHFKCHDDERRPGVRWAT